MPAGLVGAVVVCCLLRIPSGRFLAYYKVRLNASTVLMSCLGLPALTSTPIRCQAIVTVFLIGTSVNTDYPPSVETPS